ncbi:MAG TPA: hypothetical protein P5120_02655 [Spirochaetota bacterium]|nr:hypothetical protein [Spirochaetota bacterium]HPR37387.1 hypothetical protein [Spirochaetota bacterium]HRX46395.1 hypothetical protein [Spirochaetota bacterium]
MSTAIIDARGWQSSFDLKTGDKVQPENGAHRIVKEVLQKHPYPGDMDKGSNRWVSDTALELIDKYMPRFVFLSYAAQYFLLRYTPLTDEARSTIIAGAFREAERFAELSGYTPIIVGTGDMTPLIDNIDITRLDGLALCTNWSARYAGLYEPSDKDMTLLSSHPFIEKIVPREEIVRLFNGSPEQAQRVPEFLMAGRKGYAFKALSPTMKVPVMIPSDNFTVPVFLPGSEINDITGIRGEIEKLIADRNIALIIMEGIGINDFSLPYRSCSNGKEWFCYETGDAQYLTISSGEHRFFDYPKGYKYYDETDVNNEFPFSGYFKTIPENTFASSFPGRSIAVGNKSMFMHMVTGADISIECFSRNMFNQGTMAVIHRENK